MSRVKIWLICLILNIHVNYKHNWTQLLALSLTARRFHCAHSIANKKKHSFLYCHIEQKKAWLKHKNWLYFAFLHCPYIKSTYNKPYSTAFILSKINSKIILNLFMHFITWTEINPEYFLCLSNLYNNILIYYSCINTFPNVLICMVCYRVQQTIGRLHKNNITRKYEQFIFLFNHK